MTGTLYGIGVGPGDPELMTLKAVRILAHAPVIAYPAPNDGESSARAIAAAFIPENRTEIAIRVPMRPGDPPMDVYARAADEIAAHLHAGRDVAVLCEGDPFFYGSFLYLHERLAGRFRSEVVPGVSSLMACAAATHRPLARRDEALAVLPATLSDEAIEARLRLADAAAILKVGRHFPRVKALLERMDLLRRAVYVSHASRPDQRVAPLSEEVGPAPYFSMILIGPPA